LRSATAFAPNRHPRDYLRRVASLFGLVGLVLGIPLVLVLLHVTPPLGHLEHVVTTPRAVGQYLETPLTDTEVAHSLTCAAWVAWLWLVACVGLETVAAVRGRPTLHLPGSRHVHSLVTALVGASVAIFPLGRDGLPMRLHTSPAVIHSAATSAAAVGRSGIIGEVSGHDSPDPTDGRQNLGLVSVDDETTSATVGPLYRVEPGDTLWSIAEHRLGSPLRWPQIATLNYGRPQPGGGQLTDAHWIYPGWELLLPAETAGSGSSVAVESAPTTVPVSPPPTSDTADRSTPSIPGLVLAGSAHDGSHTWFSTGQRVRSEAESDTTRSRAGSSHSPVPVGLIGSGVLGAGVVTLLERMRRVQRRHRPKGLRIVLPEGDLIALERQLRVDADPEGTDAVDLGLRALVVHSLRRQMMPPQATVVRLREHALEVLVDPGSADQHAPEPFTTDGRSASWFLSRGPETLQELRDDPGVVQMDAPYPSLVTIGRDQFGVVLVDLEQAASIDITGPDGEGILATVAVELATAKWADQVDLILVGFDRDLEAFERVSHVSTIDDVLSKVHRRVRERRALLASVGRRANWEIRWIEGGDAWDLCVVICSPDAVETNREGASALVQLAGDGGRGLAVVLGAGTDLAQWHVSADDGRIELTTCETTHSVSAAQLDGPQFSRDVASLVRIAGDLGGVRPSDPPYDRIVDAVDGHDGRGADQTITAASASVDRPTAPDLSVIADPSPEVEVRVLGPIEIIGASRPFTRAWSIELIVYLAMHGNGASSDQWATALWPDRTMAAASLHSTASAARRSLGVSVSGDDHLPRAHGRLALGPGVSSDWGRFSTLSEREDPDSWREGLELIRGRPFEGLRAPDWVLLEGISANVEASVVDLAGRYAEYCLSVRDPVGAEWAARQGLVVSAYDERLYRILLRAADAAGNPAGVESVMAELVRLVAEDVEPYDAVHPETLDLYRKLSRRPSPSVRR